MASRMVRCGGEQGGIRCCRYNRFVGFGSAAIPLAGVTWTCESCQKGEKPYVPKTKVVKAPVKGKK